MRVISNYIKTFRTGATRFTFFHLEAYDEINRSLTKAFALPSLKDYRVAYKISLDVCRIQKLQLFDVVIPKNITLSRQLLKIAQKKAKTKEQKNQVEYFKFFFIRIEAFKEGKLKQFDISTEMINKLAEQQHPQSCYLVGKQLFNLSLTSHNMQQRKEMVKLAAVYFQKSLNQTQYGGLFYLAEILGNSQYSTMDEKQLREFYVFGAAMGDSLCYFKMSQIYLKEKKIALYIKYLKLAAQSGVIEAQHNLGCEYLEGNRVQKDEIKALAWFIHASVNGFRQAKYNVVYLFMNGSQCGRIKPNKKAALIKLHQLRDEGEQVDDLIKNLVQSYDKQKKEETKSL